MNGVIQTSWGFWFDLRMESSLWCFDSISRFSPVTFPLSFKVISEISFCAFIFFVNDKNSALISNLNSFMWLNKNACANDEFWCKSYKIPRTLNEKFSLYKNFCRSEYQKHFSFFLSSLEALEDKTSYIQGGSVYGFTHCWLCFFVCCLVKHFKNPPNHQHSYLIYVVSKLTSSCHIFAFIVKPLSLLPRQLFTLVFFTEDNILLCYKKTPHVIFTLSLKIISVLCLLSSFEIDFFKDKNP